MLKTFDKKYSAAFQQDPHRQKLVTILVTTTMPLKREYNGCNSFHEEFLLNKRLHKIASMNGIQKLHKI